MKLLKDANEQFENLPTIVRFALYIMVLIFCWKSFPWLLDAMMIVGIAILTFFCLLGLSSDSYNIGIQSLKQASEKILQDAVENINKKDKTKEETA